MAKTVKEAPMKIGIVLDDTLDSTDGIQQYVLCIGEWLAERGHEVHYLVGETHRTDVPNLHSLAKNIRVHFNGNRLSMPKPVAARLLSDELSRLDLDVLHVQTPYSPFFGGRFVSLAAPTTAVVGTFHILPYGRLATAGSDILGKINTKTAKRFDGMMATSRPAHDFAGKHYGFTSVVVANPFRHDVFSAARRDSPGRTKHLRVVFLGRLVPRKGAGELLKAIAELHAEGALSNTTRVIIAGKGAERERLEAYSQEHGLSDQVSFPGFVEESEKPALLASADIAVFPSLSGESFGISLLEGMAACKGVVLAGNNPGYAAVIANQEQLLDPRDTAAFARALKYWMTHSEQRRLAAEAQQAHVAQFDIDVIGPKIEAMYLEAVKKRRSLDATPQNSM